MKITVPKFVFLNHVDSTNNYANRLLLTDAAEDGSVVLAQFQTTGRGQQGNSWESDAGKNILASVILFPTFLDAANQFMISKAVSLGLFDYLSGYVNDVSIKWPNDLYIGQKKAGGILMENSVKGSNLESSVAGIGLNLNQEHFYSAAPNPVSLKMVTGHEYQVREEAYRMVEHIFPWYEKLKNGHFWEIDTAYFSALFRKNEWSRFRTEQSEFTGRITGISKYGQLRVENVNGKISDYMFREIEFVL